MKTGYIYQIENLKNNKIYIGSTSNYNRRIKEHFQQLGSGKHHSNHLQNSFNKYGKDSFVNSKVIEVSDIERGDLIKLENFYIEKYKSINRKFGYNMSIPIGNGGCISESTFKETLVLNSKGEVLKVFKSISLAAEDVKKEAKSISSKISCNNGINGNYRYVLRENYDEYRDYSFKPYSKKAKRSGKSIDKYSIDGDFIQTYNKLEDAAKDCNVDISSISGALSGRQVLSSGFRWAYTGEELKTIDKKKAIRSNRYMQKTIVQMDLDNNVLAEYSTKDLPDEFKIKGVRKCIYGQTTSYKRFKWEYKN